MMGQRSGQKQLFYSFNLDTHVPADHLLRGIDRCLDLRELRRQLAPFYSHTGRPSIDPELMVRMLLIGYSFGIRSERRLCEEVHLTLAYRWFCRQGGYRTPCLIRWPGVIKPATIYNDMFAHEDFLPTFAAAAGDPDVVA